MKTLITTTAAAAFAAALSTSAFAQASDPGTDIIGMTCGDYLNADAPMQLELVRTMQFMATGEEVVTDEAAGQVDTTDPDALALAGICEGDEARQLTSIEMSEFSGDY